MTGYLARLARRAEMTPVATGLRPFVRSASPIAEQDQRLMTPGVELDAPELGASEPTDAPGLAPAGESAPMLTSPSTATPTVQRKAAVPGVAGVDTRPPVTPPGAEPSIARWTTELESQPQSISGKEPTFHTLGDAAQPEPAFLQPSDRLEPPLSPLRTSDKTLGVMVETALATQHDEPVQPGPHVAITSSRESPNEPAPAESVSATPTDLTPHVREPDAEPVLAVPQDADGTNAGQTPRVVIGRINVEVTPPPPTEQPSAAPTKPATAAAASLIGPLGGSVPSSLRLRLRHR